MSDANHVTREWAFFIKDMIESSERVLAYTQGLDYGAFVSDRRTYDATLRNIELIGEAATHIPLRARNNNPQIPWRAIIGTRNRLAHGYLTIADEIIWSIIEDAIPKLLPALRELLRANGDLS